MTKEKKMMENMMLSENGYFNRKYDRIKQKPEKNSGKMRVELKGYISNEKRIQNIIDAGNRLMTARAMQYDFQPGEKIDEDMVDITRTPGYDPADATWASSSLLCVTRLCLVIYGTSATRLWYGSSRLSRRLCTRSR